MKPKNLMVGQTWHEIDTLDFRTIVWIDDECQPMFELTSNTRLMNYMNLVGEKDSIGIDKFRDWIRHSNVELVLDMVVGERKAQIQYVSICSEGNELKRTEKMILCIIPCGSKKIWDKTPNTGPTEAKNVYIGSFSKKCKEWAKLFYPNAWCILSAKHGFLFPNDIVPGPYNVSFKNADLNQIKIHELRKQVEEKNLNEYNQIVVLGGKFYVDKIKRLFKNVEIITPLAECKGIGYMISKLKTEIDKETLRKEE